MNLAFTMFSGIYINESIVGVNNKKFLTSINIIDIMTYLKFSVLKY